jgi:hypothetical protein
MLTRIYSYDELKERARKAMELNGFETPEYDPRFDPLLFFALTKKLDKNTFILL